ncbi:FAD-binding protein [Amycolatopsis sp. DG1A-15b]|uniref:FAD-binding protein n=1 Tax=Amycolatopsis sp. DG1A-15b TaxID=3052846 RepID=UPI00255B8965|nr:FAD-binding protein [Amycolatopsis sp. DG1A-15b]WIX91003.1 FAD-binding protein [Amycolatopsis sp. DG1A-15b]
MRVGESNWAGNLTYGADAVTTPRTVDEVRAAVTAATHVKALGSRHCFNDIADSPGGLLLDLRALDAGVELGDGTVTVAGSARYGDFARQLHDAGFALPNLASLPHITVAGSVATGTHGSGRRQPGLAAAVSGIELVTAGGELRTFTRADAEFPGLVVGLGAFGVVTRLTLDVVPAFDVRQDVFDDLPWEAAYEHFDEIEDAGYSVSMFTNWANDAIDQVWIKSRVGDFTERAGLFGAVPADGPRHPAHAAGIPADNCTPQQGVPGPWHERLPHFELAFTPSVGDELQSEYFVPYSAAAAAIRAVRGIGDLVAPLLLVSEIRAIAGDDLWLSPGHGGDRVALHFTWQPRQPEVEAVLPVIEERLAPFGARPHWGKLFHGVPGEYPRLAEFRALAESLDPQGKFRNPFLNRNVFGS